MAPKRTPTSTAPAMSQAAIRKLVRKALLASSTSLNELNLYFPPIGIEEAYKITWSEFKKLLIKKYCPRTEVKKMEDEFYNLTVKGNDLKTYIRRFLELAILCPTMVPNSEKLMEVFIGGLPRSIEGNVTTSKPQTLEEAIAITQRLMDQVTKHNSVQGTNDHKQKFDDRRTFTNNNNYQNNRNNNNNRNNDHQQQHNRRQETVKAYAVTPTENKGYTGSLPLSWRQLKVLWPSSLEILGFITHLGTSYNSASAKRLEQSFVVETTRCELDKGSMDCACKGAGDDGDVVGEVLGDEGDGFGVSHGRSF
ncbi:reverse transcriptase domain-containing protein [Tanacetum coccineum]|uniref:Reverse transcriptase domain-containing protein n=1 Tax=Tanacetum coccineum TaxID=301880 RepID=A0ABQ5I6V1_9ASTR